MKWLVKLGKVSWGARARAFDRQIDRRDSLPVPHKLIGCQLHFSQQFWPDTAATAAKLAKDSPSTSFLSHKTKAAVPLDTYCCSWIKRKQCQQYLQQHHKLLLLQLTQRTKPAAAAASYIIKQAVMSDSGFTKRFFHQ